MVTSAPLAAPICFPRHSSPSAARTPPARCDSRSSSGSRPSPLLPWIRRCPAHLGHQGPLLSDREENEEAQLRELWGQSESAAHTSASGSSSRDWQASTAGQIKVASMLAWDDADIDLLLSMQSDSLSYDPSDLSQGATSTGREQTRDDESWRRSVTAAPFSADLIRVGASASAPAPLTSVSASSGRIANALWSSYDGLGPVRGRMVAVGLSDGSTVLYQARQESRLWAESEADVASAQLSAGPGSARYSAAGSSSPMRKVGDAGGSDNYSNGNGGHLAISDPDLLANRPSSIRSSSRISFSREHSPALQTLPFDTSHSSATGLSTMSLSTSNSTSAAAAAALQIDDPSAATPALETNVTAVGESVKSPTRGAEHELEVQKAAADRNGHKHGMIGRTVEALGLASPHHRHHASHESLSQAFKSTSAGGSNRSGVDARRRSVQQQHLPASSQGDRMGAQADKATGGPSAAAAPDGGKDTPLLLESCQGSSRSIDTLAEPAPSACGSRPAGEPQPNLDDRSLRPLLRLTDAGRSAVVSLRLYQGRLRGSGSRLCLLVVHREGRVCSWSLQDGELIWSVDLSQTKWTPEAISKQLMSSKKVLEDAVALASSSSSSASAAPFDSLSPMFSQLSLSMSKATGLHTAKSLRSLHSGDPMKGAAAGEARLTDGTATWLTDDVQLVGSCGRMLAAIRDQSASSLLVVDLDAGSVVACEELESCLPTCTPAFSILSSSSCSVEWIAMDDDGKGTLRRRAVTLAAASVGGGGGGGDASGDQPSGVNVEVGDSAATAAAAAQLQDIEGDVGRFDRLFLTGESIVGLESSSVSIWSKGSSSAGNKASVVHVLPVELAQDVVEYNPAAHRLIIRTKLGFARCQLSGQGADSVAVIPFRTSPPEMAALAHEAPQSSRQTPTRLLGCFHDAQGSLQLAELNLDTGHSVDLTSTASSAPSTSCTENANGATGAPRVTAVLPLSLERIVVASSSGGVRSMSLTEFTQSQTLQGRQQQQQGETTSNSIGHGKTLIVLRQVVSPRSGGKLVVGGSAQGDVAIWDVPTLGLMATWSISTAPIEALVSFGDDDNTLRLHGCVACVAADSSVSIILLDGLRFLYSIPGRDARLRSLAVRADELLLTYDDGKARVWDLRSQELRRSIGVDQAQALVLDGKGWWTVRPIEPFSARNSGTAGVLSALSCAQGPDAATLLANFRRSIEVAARAALGLQKQGSVYGGGSVRRSDGPHAPSAAEGASGSNNGAAETDYVDEEAARMIPMHAPGARKALGILRPLLALVLPIGLRDGWDDQIQNLLGLDHSDSRATGAHLSADRSHLGLGSPDALARPLPESSAQLWMLSSLLSTQRALICLAMLKVVSHVDELHRAAGELIDAVLDDNGIAGTVGPTSFKDFSLPALTFYLLDSNAELREAARQLFDASLARMAQPQIEKLCDAWQPLLPLNQPPIMSPTASAALSLLGHIAVSRYKSFSPQLLKQISQSITILLADESQAVHQAIAIDLCSAGFSIWQHYLDATNVVRSLFVLATEANGGGSMAATSTTTMFEIRTLARQATLQIASENTPLFMTTLSIDILHARSPAHCSATMKLVAFMVRKKPEILYPNLPRLAEAVVKSLDPRLLSARDTILSSATLMISELVSTYPSISFHERSQRLAVGTHEGAVILYDLKTATRLFVLEGHRMAVSGVEFSSDGRRLVTVSEREGKVCIWKVGMGVFGFLSPGTAPKQGGKEGEAYRVFKMPCIESAGTMLSETKFEWPSERGLRVTVGETTVNLSVD